MQTAADGVGLATLQFLNIISISLYILVLDSMLLYMILIHFDFNISLFLPIPYLAIAEPGAANWQTHSAQKVNYDALFHDWLSTKRDAYIVKLYSRVTRWHQIPFLSLFNRMISMLEIQDNPPTIPEYTSNSPDCPFKYSLCCKSILLCFQNHMSLTQHLVNSG